MTYTFLLKKHFNFRALSFLTGQKNDLLNEIAALFIHTVIPLELTEWEKKIQSKKFRDAL